MNYKKCSCEHCNRDTNNWKGRFRRYNDNWYCDKHYTQLRRHNEITDNKKKDRPYHECYCEWCNRNTENFQGGFCSFNNKWYCIKHYTQLKRYNKLISDETTVCNIGINDMYIKWASENEINNRIYTLWASMIRRCYDEKHEKYKYYKDCCVCDKWLRLSGFIEDVSKIDNYELWLNNHDYQLDKDIKSNGENKCYCLEECMFVTRYENILQAIKTKNKKNQSPDH